MRSVMLVLSFCGLALTVVPSFLVFAGTIGWPTHARLMVIGAVVWFATAPAWMTSRK